MELVQSPAGTVARPLHVLVPLIKQDLKLGDEERERAGMDHYRAAGEKMLEAKPQMARGEFISWITRNFKISKQHAARYMAFARATAGEQKSRYETFSEFMREDGGDRGYGKVVRKREWHDPVKEAIGKVNIDLLMQEALKQKEERALQRKLSLSLIDIGYKALATKLHPDKGGSREAMTRLNRVRDFLRKAVTA